MSHLKVLKSHHYRPLLFAKPPKLRSSQTFGGLRVPCNLDNSESTAWVRRNCQQNPLGLILSLYHTAAPRRLIERCTEKTCILLSIVLSYVSCNRPS